MPRRAPVHGTRTDQPRLSACKRGYNRQWQAAAKAFLQQHPLCAACEKKGLLELAEVVDHIIPHRGNLTLFWAESNWQALSKRCHDAKTAAKDGGFGRS